MRKESVATLWSITVTVFKKETESLWACNNVWRWLLACCEIVSFVLYSNDFHIALYQFLICFKFCGSCDVEFDCIELPDSSSSRLYTSWGGLLALKSVSWHFNIVESVWWYGCFCLELPCSLTSRSCTVLKWGIRIHGVDHTYIRCIVRFQNNFDSVNRFFSIE